MFQALLPKNITNLGVFIPKIYHLISELEFRFSSIQVNAICGLYLIPQHLDTMTKEHSDNTLSFFELALPFPETFNQEIEVWKARWQGKVITVPQNLTESLASCDYKLFPNVYTCLYLLLIIPVSTAATECSHSCLKIVKSKLQSNMGEEKLNALMLLYVHKDIGLDYNKAIDIYANRYPRRMIFLNPMKEDD